MDSICTDIVAVIASEHTRRDRIILRDTITKEAANSRISAQHSDDYYCRPGVTIIANDGNLEDLGQKALQVASHLKARWG